MGIPTTLNRYTYCQNNPVNLVEYNGLYPSMTQGDANKMIYGWYFNEMERAWDEKVQSVKDALDPSPEPRTYSLGIGNLSDSDYIGCMYLVKKNGAAMQGHAAMLLIKENGMSEFYSYAGVVEAGAVTPGIGSNGYLSTHVSSQLLTELPCNMFFNDRGTYADNVSHPGVSGEKIDRYTNGIYIPITDVEGQSHNCNMVAQIILQAGGKDFAPDNFSGILGELLNGERPVWCAYDIERGEIVKRV